MHNDEHEKKWMDDHWRYASASMKWYGWGSPVGLSIFFLTLAACAIAIRYVFFIH